MPTAATPAHGGGAFSGKDPTKVDRSARLHGALHRQEPCRGRSGRQVRRSQLAYAIGVAHPVSVLVETLRHRQDRRRPA
ncbi:MAG: methionine adenosyltransferase domain-containing protein [Acutalibacteraceae bacterium]